MLRCLLCLAPCIVQSKLGDRENQNVGLSDAAPAAAEGPPGIAVVGNGPISQADFSAIQASSEVFMFNDLKNLLAPSNKFTSWVVRASGEEPDKLLGVSHFSKSEGYDYHKALNHKDLPPALGVLKTRLSKLGSDLKRILVIANGDALYKKMKAENPGTIVEYAPVHERDRDTTSVPATATLTFGGCASYPHKTTGCGPSSGTIALDHLFAQRKKRGSKEWIHIYGMNWAFHAAVFASCCNPDREVYKTKGFEGSCCDDCHNFYREEKVIKKCCTAENHCQVHPTPNKNHFPFEWGPRDVKAEKNKDTPEKFDMPEEELAEMGDGCHVPEECKPGHCIFEPLLKPVTGEGGTCQISFTPGEGCCYNADKYTTEKGEGNENVEPPASSSMPPPSDAARDAAGGADAAAAAAGGNVVGGAAAASASVENVEPPASFSMPSAAAPAAAEGPSGIAVVGNGPISQADFSAIQASSEVFMFNDLKNLLAPSNKFTSWVVRASGEEPDKLLGVSHFSKSEGYDYHKALNHKDLPPALGVLKTRLSKLGSDLKRILVIANGDALYKKMKAENPGTIVEYAPVHERDRDTTSVPATATLTFGGCASYPHKTTGCGPSSGTIALDHLFAQRKKRGSKEWIHIYGMNWAFHAAVFASCCNPDREVYKTKGFEGSCCDDCHNFYREEKVIKKCCTAENHCQVHPTPNKNHFPFEWGPRDVKAEKNKDTPEKFDMPEEELAEMGDGCHVPEECKPGHCIFEPLLKPVTGEGGTCQISFTPGEGCCYNADKYTTEKGEGNENVEPPASSSMPPPSDAARDAAAAAARDAAAAAAGGNGGGGAAAAASASVENVEPPASFSMPSAAAPAAPTGQQEEFKDSSTSDAASAPGVAVAYAISLPEESANFKRLFVELEKHGIQLNLWPGVKLQRNVAGKLDDFRLRHFYNSGAIRKDEDISIGDTGLAVAHMSLWEQLHTWLPDDQLALVFEDDEHILDEFGTNLRAILKALGTPIDFINLNALRQTGKPVEVPGLPKGTVYRAGSEGHADKELDCNVWLSAYALSKTGIKKLLAGLKKHPVSNDGQHGIIDHAVGWVIENTPSIKAYTVQRNVVSFHNETISFREGLNDGQSMGTIQQKGT